LKRRVHALVAELHGLHGVGAEGHAGTYLAELGRLLVHSRADVAVVQGDGEREACDAAAYDGDLEGLLGHCVVAVCTVVEMVGRVEKGCWWCSSVGVFLVNAFRYLS